MDDYYTKSFENNKGDALYVKWNWAAFLFIEVWLFYRKMYAYGSIYLALNLVNLLFACAMLMMDKMTNQAAIFVVIIPRVLIKIFLGFYGTSIYQRFIKRKNNITSRQEIPVEYYDYNYGHTSFIMACICMIFSFFVELGAHGILKH